MTEHTVASTHPQSSVKTKAMARFPPTPLYFGYSHLFKTQQLLPASQSKVPFRTTALLIA